MGSRRSTELDGVTGTTVVHICFGYAAIIHERPGGYSFLTQFKNCSCRQVSIETAQSKLDCSVLSELGGKEVLLGVIDLSDMNVETPEAVASRIRRALPFVPASHRPRLRDEISPARCRLRQDAGDGRGCQDRPYRSERVSLFANEVKRAAGSFAGNRYGRRPLGRSGVRRPGPRHEVQLKSLTLI
jgi:hypothetical protein